MKAKTLLISTLFLIRMTASGELLSRWNIKPGGYSGITSLGNNRYAIVDDKQNQPGFHRWHININLNNGKIEEIQDEGYYGITDTKNRDMEDIAFAPWRNSVFICGEADQQVIEHALNGKLTGQRLSIPEAFSTEHIEKNYGFESLCTNAEKELIWTVTERPLKGVHNGEQYLLCFDKNLTLLQKVPYKIESPQTTHTGRSHIHGISAITCLPDGQMLILEREALIARKYMGSKCWCKIFRFDLATGTKQLVTQLNSKFTLTNTRFANYEGMCLGPTLSNGHSTLLLISDSEGGYGRGPWRLKDRIQLIILP